MDWTVDNESNPSINLSELRQLCLGESSSDEEEVAFSWLRWIITGPLSVALALLSTYGNLVSLKILRSLRIRKSVRFYLSVLAVFNAAISQCTLWYYAIGESVKPFSGDLLFFDAMTVALHPISNFTLTMSVWMVLTVTCDRYFALARPLQHRAYDSKARAILITVVLIILAMLFCFPTAFELTLSSACSRYLAPDESPQYMLLPTPLRLEATYIQVYQVILRGLLVAVGPLFLITWLSLRMLCIVYSARTLRSNIEANYEKSKHAGENTTMMLLTVVAKFLICNAPAILLNLWENSLGSIQTSDSILFKWCVEVSNLLVTANSASDSIVYLRWKTKQNRNVTYTAIPKSMFSASEAAYIKRQYHDQRDNLYLMTERLGTVRSCEEEQLTMESLRPIFDVMVDCIGDAMCEQRMITSLNEMGSQYAKVAISPANWNKFKDEFVKEFSTDDDGRLWSKLVCMLIKEFRKGQFATAAEQRSSARCNNNNV